jgi:hypothetical protein
LLKNRPVKEKKMIIRIYAIVLLSIGATLAQTFTNSPSTTTIPNDDGKCYLDSEIKERF